MATAALRKEGRRLSPLLSPHPMNALRSSLLPAQEETLGVHHISTQIVRNRMKSVKNIQKITKAVKMVAASKLRQIQSKAENSCGFWQPFTALLGDTPSILEVNFVEPSHHKQGFECTTVLARLDTKLVTVQKTFWSTNCHKIVYAPRRNKTSLESTGREMIVLAMKWRFRTKVVHSNPEAVVGGLASMILVHILVVVLSVLSAGGTSY